MSAHRAAVTVQSRTVVADTQSHDDQSKKLKRGRSTEPRRWPVVNIDHINVYNIQFKLHESRMTEITEELQEISAKVEDKPRRDRCRKKGKRWNLIILAISLVLLSAVGAATAGFLIRNQKERENKREKR
ncbi:hypothetical protein INR49_011671 [Caranx melampygus]|nr:hypothetical protein INR49_011671 [Caranx melampygus]